MNSKLAKQVRLARGRVQQVKQLQAEIRESGGQCVDIEPVDVVLVESMGYMVDLETGEMEKLPDDEPAMIRVPIVGELTSKQRICAPSLSALP